MIIKKTQTIKKQKNKKQTQNLPNKPTPNTTTKKQKQNIYTTRKRQTIMKHCTTIYFKSLTQGKKSNNSKTKTI